MAEIGSAFLSILPSARDLPSQLNKQVSPGLASVGKKTGLSFGKLFAAGAALGIGAKAFDFLGDSLDEAREAQKVGALTENVIRTTGKAANVSAVQVGKLTSAISLKTGVDDEAIQSGANLLLTFTKVANAGKGQAAIFDRATKAAVDLSASGFGDINGASKQLGKALQDPIKGITALGRSGVTFTEQQKDLIKTLLTSGQVTKAQGLILNEVEKQVGGAAAATATFGEKASVAFGNIKEQVGTALLPLLDRFFQGFLTQVPRITRFIDGIGPAFTRLQAIAAPVGTQVAGAFDRIRAGVQAALPTIRQFGGFLVNEYIPALKSAVVPIIDRTKDAIANLTQAYRDNKPAIDSAGKSLRQIGAVVATKVIPAFLFVVANALPRTINGLAAVVRVVGPFIRAFSQARSAIQNFTVNVVRGAQAVGVFALTVRAKIQEVIGVFNSLGKRINAALGGIPAQMASIGVQIINGLVRGILSSAGRVAAAVSRIISTIPPQMRKFFRVASPSKVTTEIGAQVGAGLAKGLTESQKKAKAAAKRLVEGVRDTLKDRLSGLRDDLASLSDSVKSNFTSGLFDATTASGFLSNLTTAKGNLTGLLAAFKTLRGFGLPSTFLAQLFADGGAPLILDLAKNKDQAAAAASIFGDVQSLSSQLGDAVGNEKYGDKIDETNALLTKLVSLQGGAAVEFAKEINGATTAAKKRGNKGKGNGGKKK